MNKPLDQIIERVLDGLATPSEARLVAKWFATDDGQQYLSRKMDRDFARIKSDYEELMIDHKIPSDEIFRAVSRSVRRKKINRILFRAAAVLLPAVILGGLFMHVNSRVDLLGTAGYEEVYVPKGERIQFVFQDGTRAYLNSDSKIRFPKQFSLRRRSVSLEGEAYFVVQKDSRRPFVVDLGKGVVRVTGTEFNVEAYPDDKNIRVTLDEGEINLTPWTEKIYQLRPGEKIIFNKESGRCVVVRTDNTRIVSLWKEHIIAFADTPLAQVTERLNRWFDVPFVIEDSATLRHSYTFYSENTSLKEVLRDLEKVAPVEFLYQNDTVRVRLNTPDFK